MGKSFGNSSKPSFSKHSSSKPPFGQSPKKQGNNPLRRNKEDQTNREDRPRQEYSDRPRQERSDRPFVKSDRQERSDRPFVKSDRQERSDRPFVKSDRQERSDRPFVKSDRQERSDRPFVKSDRQERSDRPFVKSDRQERSDRPRQERSDRPRQERSDRPFVKSDRQERSDRPFVKSDRQERSDRPRQEYSDRPRQERSDRPRQEYSDRPRQERSDRPRQEYSDRPRQERSDRPRQERSDRPRQEYSDRPRQERSDRPRQEYSDRPRQERSDRPRQERSDRPRQERSDRPRQERSDRPRQEYSDRPRQERSDRPRQEYSDRPRQEYSDRPRQEYSDRPRQERSDRPRQEYSDRPRQEYSDRPRQERSDRPRQERFDRPRQERSDRPRQEYSDRSEQSPKSDSQATWQVEKKEHSDITVKSLIEAKISPARAVAYMVLKALEQEGAFLQPLLDKLSQEADLSPEDRRLAWEITLGVSRYWSRLLYSVKYYIKPKEGEEIPKEILRILVIAAYQFTFLDKIPAHAIINEAVELAKIVNIRLKNLVNGTLRSFQKDGEQYKDGNRPEELAVRLSHPTWWVEYQLESKPLSDVLALARFNNGHAPLTVRFNPKFNTKETLDLLAQENATVTKAKYVPNAYHLEHPQPFQSETFKDQRWIVQDEGSQLIVHLLGVKPGSKVWDVCAAPGGKTTLLWDLMQHQGQILATETNDRKAKDLSEKLKDETDISVVIHDASKPLAQKQQFDYILIDAPCSALGVIRRHPEIKWRRQPIDIKSSAVIQEKILNQASLYLKKGGYLVYSVCSDHPLEGMKQIQKFLLVNPDFKIVQPDLQSPIDWTKLLDANLSLNIDPYHHQTDGFFAIRLRKG